MGKSEEIYWQRWQKLIEAAANFQELLTGSVMIGGSAVALHLKHRYSFDADHILSDLKENYKEVLDFLEGRDNSILIKLDYEMLEAAKNPRS